MSVTFNQPLPALSPELQSYSEHCQAYIQQRMQGQSIPFEQFMQDALYAPQWGYYTGGLQKLGGSAGDFITAPEMSPWFGATLAQQLRQVLQANTPCRILEFGAGSGKLAAHLLAQLLPDYPQLEYYFLELSPDLRQRQQANTRDYQSACVWLNELPSTFAGIIIANEVLDAMPVKSFAIQAGKQVFERYVQYTPQNGFQWDFQPAQQEYQDYLLEQLHATHLDVAIHDPYYTEIGVQANAWIRSISSCLSKGFILLIDYGYSASEYFHPLRHQGTLRAYCQHLTHTDVLRYVGVQDITANVNFSALADTAYQHGLDVLGYTSQAHFLMNCGLPQLISTLDPQDTTQYAPQISAIQTLINEDQMGEVFKVLALGKGVTVPLIGFQYGNRLHRL